MKSNLPNINFESANQTIEGIDIVKIEDLFARRKSFDHNPEAPHQPNFNLLLFFTEGSSRHLVDFVWQDVNKNTILHISKGQIHAFKFNKNIRGFIVLFTDKYLKNLLNILPKNEIVRLFNSQLFSPKVQLPQDSEVLQYVNLLYSEVYNEEKLLNKQDVCNSLFTILLSKLETLKQHQTSSVKTSKN